MTEEIRPAFNLLDEPWIPVRSPGGGVREVSLTQALLEADRFSALAETSPPNLIALHRLLLAVVHRALTTQHGPWKDADRVRWYRKGLPEAPIRAYLDQWRERFWLFHPEYPFMQVAGLAEWPETATAIFPVASVSVNLLYGKAMFDHRAYETVSRDAPMVLRDMLGYFQFTPQGFFPGKKLKSSDKAGPLTNTAAIVPTGQTLAETLLIGLHPPNARGLDDLPAWEQPRPDISTLQAAGRLASGPNDRYTRQTRAVLLISEGVECRIRQVHMAAGMALEEDTNAPDPMACYRFNKDGEAIRLSFAEGRAVWRDLPALLPDSSGKSNQTAPVLAWATYLHERMGQFDAPVPVLVAGLASDQGKLLRWRVERFDLPLPLLANPDAAAEIRARIRGAEDTFSRLRWLCSEMIANAMPDPNHKDTKARARDILDNGPTAAVFYSIAERALPDLMQRIATGDVEAAYSHWLETLKLAAWQAWAATCRCLGDSPRAMRAQARSSFRFRGLLHSLEQPDAKTIPTEAIA